ncbi:MAG: AI-2E family transporter [Burkholderiaceae bacterium]|nr:AI-2E family transporter [Burkholderiaceae bacterium]
MLWVLRDVVLLCFGAIVLSSFLGTLKRAVGTRMRLPPRAALLLAVVCIVVLLSLTAWGVGVPMARQLEELGSTLPAAWAAFQHWVGGLPLGQRMLDWMGSAKDMAVPWAKIAGVASRVTTSIANILLIFLLGIYLALDPDVYFRGALSIVPSARRGLVGNALEESGNALRRWLLGQFITMAIVGVTVGVGLALLGMPLALAIGLLAGLFEFVPFFGALAAALLAVLLAFAQGPVQALHVALFFLVVQQLEGNVLTPMVQKWAAHLPPVMSLLSVVIFGTLFGIAGVVLGTPLMVVVLALVQKLYVENVSEQSKGFTEAKPGPNL